MAGAALTTPSSTISKNAPSQIRYGACHGLFTHRPSPAPDSMAASVTGGYVYRSKAMN